MGYLWAWLKRGHLHASKQDHCKDNDPRELLSRQFAREELKALPAARPWLEAERQKRPGEADEPANFP
eukprot:1384683-Pyramimonas_sp.AAC.1